MAVDDESSKVRAEAIYLFGKLYLRSRNLQACNFLAAIVKNDNVTNKEKKVAYFSLLRVLEKDRFIGQGDIAAAYENAKAKVQSLKDFLAFDASQDIEWDLVNEYANR